MKITPAILTNPNAATKPPRTLHMVSNERTAGSIPAWKTQQTAHSKTLSNFSKVQNTSPALAYQNINQETKNQEFTFSDLIDMVNPLHHIPLVNHAYRKISGDTIRPSSQIIGGAVFAGPLGAASGIINAVLQEETGKNTTQNALNFIKTGQTPKITPKNAIYTNKTINNIEWNNPDNTNALTTFADLTHPNKTQKRGIIKTSYND